MKRKHEEHVNEQAVVHNEESMDSRMKCRRTNEHKDPADDEDVKSGETKGCKTVASATWVQKLTKEELNALDNVVKEQQRQWRRVQEFILSVITR